MTDRNHYKSLGNKRVLVVEDVELNQYLAQQIMHSWGFEVEIACNGEEALRILSTRSFDLILMDIQMPVMDGVETTRLIRRLSGTDKASIPIIALTANAMKGEREVYLEAGMNDCLLKPVEEKQLFDIIAKNIRGYAIPASDQPGIIEDQACSMPLYDLSMIYSISGGDEEFVNKMVKLFLETMPITMKEMKSALERKEWEEVGKTAHKMKSTIDSLAIVSLKEEIRKLEQNGRKKEHLETIPLQVEKILNHMNLCINAVQKHFNW